MQVLKVRRTRNEEVSSPNLNYGPARAADCYLDLLISHQEFNSSAAILLNNQVVSSCQLLFFSNVLLRK